MVVVFLAFYFTVFAIIRAGQLEVQFPFYYVSYIIFPLMSWIPLGVIVLLMIDHCEQGEYVSFASEQRPPDPRDWDIGVGSESSLGEEQQDESEQALGEHHNEGDVVVMATEKTQPLLINQSINDHEGYISPVSGGHP